MKQLFVLCALAACNKSEPAQPRYDLQEDLAHPEPWGLVRP